MNYKRFATYNVVGGLLWVTIFLFAGYLFGNIPFVKNNFEIVTIGIVLVSVLPMVFEFWKERQHSKREAAARASGK
jgi:membrane-associated protein